jgi:integrase
MAKRRFLPQYVTVFRDRHGKERFRFRRKGYTSRYFASALGTEGFRQEYRSFMDAPESSVAVAIERAVPGTIDDLVTRYLATPSRLGPTIATQSKVRAILSRFREAHGTKPVARIGFEHIDAIVAAKLPKILVGKRMEGGVEAARKLRKELVRLFDFAVKIKMRSDNPVTQAERVKVARGERSKGFHTWTEIEIAQYRTYHPIGSKPRLAMELMLWTGQRRIDAIRMGRQHIQDGRVEFIQTKGGRELGIPVAPQLLEAIVAMPISDKGHLCFLVTEQGKPFSNPGFGNWFREQCDAAGLHQCTAHGLRKAMMRRLAELHMSNQTLKSVSGHENDAEVATYTRGADQRRMADDAIRVLASWERSTQSKQSEEAGIENR